MCTSKAYRGFESLPVPLCKIPQVSRLRDFLYTNLSATQACLGVASWRRLVCPIFRVQPMAPQHLPRVRTRVAEYGLNVKPCSPRHAPGLKRCARRCLVCKYGYAHVSGGACCHFVFLPPLSGAAGHSVPLRAPRGATGACAGFLSLVGCFSIFSDFSGLTFCQGYDTLKVLTAPCWGGTQIPCK